MTENCKKMKHLILDWLGFLANFAKSHDNTNDSAKILRKKVLHPKRQRRVRY